MKQALDAEGRSKGSLGGCLLLCIGQARALVLKVLLQMRHLALELLIALLGSSLCLPCYSEPVLITMAFNTLDFQCRDDISELQ